ncbi:uncharacterized protein LOC133201053 [Saccostrea echinata]|uniref:uncharacterized protein LOC133201053 n=1 Tax=Saccostrea echinata TaxID=191078 RepID=UPI002A82767E|nr:uncharacterized protein LOC133201053 [Saccostrea echinata]
MDFKEEIRLCFLFTVVLLTCLSDNVSGQQRTTECKNSGGAYAWLSCLIAKANKDMCNPSGCARYAGTEFEKDLTCTFQKQRCGGCVPQYKLNGTEVSCKALEQTGYECAPGVQMEVCNLDACVATLCRPYLTAPCRNNFCGGCFAEYDVDGQWRRCPIEVSAIQPDSPVIPGQTLEGFADVAAAPAFASSAVVPQGPIRSEVKPRDPIIPTTCPNGELPWDCPADVCTNAYCAAYPQAKCRINNCGGCSPEFTTGIYLIQDCNSRECPKNTLEMVCKDDPCKYSTCRKYEDKNPVCRPSRCGGCRAMWYVNGEEVDCYEQYGVDVPCPNGERRQQCPKSTCRFKHCPVDRSITCVINNCGGCHREYQKRTSTGKTIIVDESRCQGWWNLQSGQKKKKPFLSKKRPLPRPINEISPNELDPMARRNNERTVNAINKFEAAPKGSLNMEIEPTPGAIAKALSNGNIIQQGVPPPIPANLMEEHELGMQQFIPKSNFPEIPSGPTADQVLENPLLNSPISLSNIDSPPSNVALDYPKDKGTQVSEKVGHLLGKSGNSGNTQILENPLINDKNSQLYPPNKDLVGVQEIQNPLLINQQPRSSINAVPLENIAPSVPASDLSVEILNNPNKRKLGSIHFNDKVPSTVPEQIKKSMQRDRFNVGFLDSTTRAFPSDRNNRRTRRRFKAKERGAKVSSMNFWKTDMQLPPAFFEFMLQGMGFHGIPLEGLQKM